MQVSTGARRKRHDPTPRHTQLGTELTSVLGRKPGHHYVLVSQNKTSIINDEYYSAIGYKVVRAEPKGPRLFVGQTVKEGEPIEYMSQVLMECDAERYQEIRQHGIHGNGGLARAEELEKKIRNGGGFDARRGALRRAGLHVQTEVETAEI